MKRIVFWGDSITDCGRNRNDLYNLGEGYANLIRADLGYRCPGAYEFMNHGIGGNRIVDLYARIKAGFLNWTPDYASIYVGVNDAWHEIAYKNGIATAKFEKLYEMMLDEILEALPDIKLMLIAPFVLEGYNTCNTEEIPDRLERFRVDVAEKAAVTKKMAEKYNLPLIELQPAFDAALERAPAEYWAYDGVHPTVCGHEIIKRLWLETFEKMK